MKWLKKKVTVTKALLFGGLGAVIVYAIGKANGDTSFGGVWSSKADLSTANQYSLAEITPKLNIAGLVVS